MEADITLMELLEGLHDPRAARGKRHPLAGLALLGRRRHACGHDHVRGDRRLRQGTRLGVPPTPRLHPSPRVVQGHLLPHLPPHRCRRLRGGRLKPGNTPHLAIDGKTLRGSRDGETPAVHLLSAYAPDVEAVVAQMRVDAKTNELKAALEMLAILPIKGRLITADAIQTHRAICAAVIEGGGDYILPVKDNQPTLRADIEAAFAEPEAGLSPLQSQ